MKNNESGSVRVIVMIGAALLGGACILQTAAPTAQFLVVTATPDGTVANPSSQAPDSGTAPTWTLILSPELTRTATIAQVTLTAGQALSCVKGPDWKLYEWAAGIAEGETVTLIARAVPEIPDYYVVRKSDGMECWAFSGSSTISGSVSSLPVRETPPLPQVTYVIENKVMIPLCEVYIRGKDETVWGANRLSAQIFINASFGITLTAGYYDVQIMDCAPTVLYEAHDRAIGSDPTYRHQLIANDVHFALQNGHGYSICRFEIRPSIGGAWQYLYNSATDGGPINSGERRNVVLRVGLYDFRVTRCTGAVIDNINNFYFGPEGTELIMC